MKSLDVAHAMNSSASFLCFDELGTARPHAHNQAVPFFVAMIGAATYPRLDDTFERFGSNSMPAATVASIHMPQCPSENNFRFSLKPLRCGFGGPYWVSRFL